MRNLNLLTALTIFFAPTVMIAQPMDAQRATIKPVRSYATRLEMPEDPESLCGNREVEWESGRLDFALLLQQLV